MNPTFRSLLVAGIATLALPAAASAATFEVKSAGDLTKAADAAVSGDTIHLAAGVYAVNPVVKAAGVTIAGDPGAVLVTAKADATPVLSFAAASGTPDTVTGLIVIGAAGAAVSVGNPGLTVQRSVLYSASADALSSAIALPLTDLAGAAPPRAITIDSSFLVAPKGAGITATAARALDTQTVGATTVAGRHVSIVAARAVVADSTGAATPVTGQQGAVSATFADSILLGAQAKGAAADAITLTRSRAADDPALAPLVFVDPGKLNLHLRADAVDFIGKGGITDGESDRDIDGDARSAGGVSDLGADEFVNRAPAAALAAPTGTLREGQAVTLDASGSADPEASIGGGVVAYAWDFGDGQTATTSTPRADHVYARRGAYAATVTVTDRQGAASAPASAAIAVLDGVKPTAKVSSPFAGQKVRIYRKAGRRGRLRRVRAQFFGSAADDAGLSGIAVALRRAGSANGTCRWFDGRAKLVKGPCSTPVYALAKLDGTQWSYVLARRARLPRGTYRLTVVPVDASRLAGDAQTVRFRIR